MPKTLGKSSAKSMYLSRLLQIPKKSDVKFDHFDSNSSSEYGDTLCGGNYHL